MEQKVLSIISQVLNVSREAITEDVGPGLIEGWDSMATIGIVTAIEDELAVKFSVREIVEIKRVRDILAILRARSS